MLLVVSRDLFRAFPSSLCQPPSPFGPGAIMHSLVPLGMKQSASLTAKIRPTEHANQRPTDRAEESASESEVSPTSLVWMESGNTTGGGIECEWLSLPPTNSNVSAVYFPAGAATNVTKE